MLLWPGGSVAWSIVPHTKRLQVRFPGRARVGGNQWMFLSHTDVSFSLSLSFSLSNQFKKHFLRRGVKKFLKEKPDAVGHSGRFPQLQWSKLEGGRQPGLGNAETPGDKDPNLSPLRRNIKITLRANIIIFQALCNFFNFIEI